MAAALAHEKAEQLSSALRRVLQTRDGEPLDLPPESRDAIERLSRALTGGPLLVLPVDTMLSTQEAAELLGVSRMTVVRLIERGELEAEGGGVHRRIAAAEVDRYRSDRGNRRRTALLELAGDIDDDTPPDRLINTR